VISAGALLRPGAALLTLVTIASTCACTSTDRSATPSEPQVGNADVAVRGVFGHDSSASGYTLQAGKGFNAFDIGPERSRLDALARDGLKAIVWLGGWSNVTCSWEHDDSWIQPRIGSVADSHAIAAYYLGDEPQASKCPAAPAMFRARTALVHELDPNHPTLTVISAFDAGRTFPYAEWKGSTDILAFDVYPCNRTSAQCDFDRIDAAIGAIRNAGITRYWAVIQAFEDSYYRLPSPIELHEEFQRWRRSSISGYLVFSWSYLSFNLEHQPEHLRQLEMENSVPLH
jgi:hypothetical protein